MKNHVLSLIMHVFYASRDPICAIFQDFLDTGDKRLLYNILFDISVMFLRIQLIKSLLWKRYIPAISFSFGQSQNKLITNLPTVIRIFHVMKRKIIRLDCNYKTEMS